LLFFTLCIFFSTLSTEAAKSSIKCNPINDKACLIINENSNNDELIIFFRGHYKRSGRLPSELYIKAAKSAISNFNLEDLFLEKNTPVLVTGSSHLDITKSDIEKIESLYQISIKTIHMAAHSGGYVGMGQTLSLLKKDDININNILMLDSWYSSSANFHKLIKSYILKGSSCIGFTTYHNQERFERFYRSLGCKSEGPDGYTHNASVYPFLKRNI